MAWEAGGSGRDDVVLVIRGFFFSLLLRLVCKMPDGGGEGGMGWAC